MGHFTLIPSKLYDDSRAKEKQNKTKNNTILSQIHGCSEP